MCVCVLFVWLLFFLLRVRACVRACVRARACAVCACVRVCVLWGGALMGWEEGGEQDPKILIAKRVNSLSSSKGRYADTATTLSSFVADLLRATNLFFQYGHRGQRYSITPFIQLRVYRAAEQRPPSDMHAVIAKESHRLNYHHGLLPSRRSFRVK